MFHINQFQLLIFFFSLFGFNIVFGQVNHTANDRVMPYDAQFGYGFNPGYNPPWTDEQLADIGAGSADINGLNANCIRPTLPEHFMEEHGYDMRVKTLKHYNDIGLVNNTMFVGYPSEAHRDTKIFCDGKKAEVFANMYEPIWDNGENGTPVNDNNYYALYLYKTVTRYKDYVKFWEIWNEPDFDYTFSKGWLPSGLIHRGNWWDNNPEPCDYAMKAPVFYYVRMLRISWEVIKTLDPDAYVTTGGLGYPSFLDAIMRNTDNPIDGTTTAEYDKKGGAYFDVLSFHSYPHNDGSLKKWNTLKAGFELSRHSDAASNGVIDKKKEFADVLNNYGYDGKKYPEKLYILTEVNVPRIKHEAHLGSDKAQRNFIIKSLINCQQNDILQYHVYCLGDGASFDGGGPDFRSMGMFEKLEGIQPYEQKFRDAGIAYKTTATILKNKKYDPVRTLNMALPNEIGGAAFIDMNGDHTYALWAKTSKDLSEQASAYYEFPAVFDYDELTVKRWDFGKTEKVNVINETTLALTGSPVFVNSTPPFQSLYQKTSSKQSVSKTGNSFIDNFEIPTQTKKNKLPKTNSSNTDEFKNVNLTIKIKGQGEVKILTGGANEVINCETDCTNEFLESSTISITAIPKKGFSFVGWEGISCQNKVTCSFAMKKERQITAVFEMINSSNSSNPQTNSNNQPPNSNNEPASSSTYNNQANQAYNNGAVAVKVRVIGPGAVMLQARGYQDRICEGECSFSYASKTHVTFSAIPADDHTFTGWIGTGCYGNAQCYRILDWDMEVNVNFVPGIPDRIYEEEEIGLETPMNIIVKGAGKVVITTPDGYKYECRSNCQESVSQGSRISMLAVPIHGYYFVGWEGDASVCKGTGKCFMKVKSEKQITAIFAPIKHMIPKKGN